MQTYKIFLAFANLSCGENKLNYAFTYSKIRIPPHVQ
jgi:hypothetical protein